MSNKHIPALSNKHIPALAALTLAIGLVGCSSTKVTVGGSEIKVHEDYAIKVSSSYSEQSITQTFSSVTIRSSTTLLTKKDIEILIITIENIKTEIPGISDSDAQKILEAQQEYMRTVIYPKIVESQKKIIEGTINNNLTTKKHSALRDWCWNTAANYKAIPELYEPIKEFVDFQINTRINPANWEKVEAGIGEEFDALIAEKKYAEAIAYVQNYVKENIVGGYSSVLDKNLDDITAELIALGVNSEEINAIAEQTKILIYNSANLVDLTDSVTVEESTTVVEGDPAFSPDLAKYEALLKQYRETLRKYGVIEPEIDRIIAFYQGSSNGLIQELYKGESSGVSTTSTTKETIGTHALNIRILALGDAYILKANIARLKDATTNDAEILKIVNEVASVNDEYLNILEGELRMIVATMVEQGKFAEARDFAWNLCASENEVVNERLRPIASELLLTEVNPAHWAIIEADVKKNIDELLAQNKYFEAIDFIKNYPRVQTYSSSLNMHLANTLAIMKEMGYSEEALAEVEADVKARIARSENILCEIDAIETTVTRVEIEDGDTTALEASLATLHEALLRHDCTRLNADAIISRLRRVAKAEAVETTDNALLLGTMAINNRLDQAAFELSEQVDDILTNNLIEQVKAAVEKNDFETARNLIRDVQFFGTKRDIKIYALRVGLLNSYINPHQYNYLIAQIEADVAAFKAAGDYAGLKKYIEEYPYVHDDYAQIKENLDALVVAMTETPWVSENDVGVKTEVSTALVNELATVIQLILERREGVWTDELPSLDAVEKALSDLDQSLIAQFYNPEAISALHNSTMFDIKEIIYAGLENLTTYELNEKLRIKLSSYIVLENGKSVDDMVEIAEIQDEISFESQIAIAKDAIKEQLTLKDEDSVVCSALKAMPKDVNNLLGEYARVMRILEQGQEITADEATSLVLGAAYLNQSEVIDFAVKLGADVNGVTDRDPRQRTAMLLAIEAGNAGIINTLVQAGASLKSADAAGNTTLHYAIQAGNLSVIKVVLKDAEVNAVNNAGESALFVAVRNNNGKQVEVLAAAEGINLNLANAEGATAIDVACAEGCLEALDALAQAGVEYSEAQLAIAAANDQLGIAQWLVAKGVDVNGANVMASAIFGSATEEYLILEGGIPEAPAVEPAVEAPAATEAAPANASEKIVGTIDLTISAE